VAQGFPVVSMDDHNSVVRISGFGFESVAQGFPVVSMDDHNSVVRISGFGFESLNA